ncbi:MAG: cation diffusion facilitator family transporter [Candidatus Omnitrophota bacterium]|nr:cation diffusion facilitator family transporter [Candidatus Omnitrophota bacterium]
MPRIHEYSYKIGEKGARLGIFSNILLFALKLFAGIAGRSQAMIADALHTGSDILVSVGVFVGFKIAGKPADKHHPFGHGRAESIVAKIVSLILILVGLGIAYNSARTLIAGSMVEPGAIALVAAVISIIIKEITYRRVIAVSNEIKSTSLKAEAYHHRSDVLSSVAALIGIAGAKLGKTFMDPLAGIIVAGFIIKIGAEAFHAAYDELMDAAPPEEFRKKIENSVLGVEGVEEVKKIMVRKTGIEFFIEVVIGVDGGKTVEEGHLVTMKIRKDLFRDIQNVRDIIVHVEPRGITD